MACTKVIRCDEMVESIAIAPDGQLLAVVSEDILLLDAGSGETRRRLGESITDATNSVAFSPASSSPLLLASGSSDNIARVWDCSSGACVAELHGHAALVNCIAFSPDGRLLASASWDQTVRLWRTNDWRAPPAVLRGHRDCVPGVSFSCDGRLLASCSGDETVRLWHVLDSGAASAAAPAPAPAAAAGPVLQVKKWVNCISFSPVDSTLLACCAWKGFLALARVSAGDGAVALERKLRGHTEDVHSLAFSPCGQKLASGSLDYTVRLWSVASGKCLRVLREHIFDVSTVAFFPDGKQLATGSGDKTIRIWALSWSDQTHRHFSARLKAAVFTLMCVRARLERTQSRRRARLPRLPMEMWLLVFGQLQLALDAKAGCI